MGPPGEATDTCSRRHRSTQDLWALRAFPAISLPKAQRLHLVTWLPAVKARGISSMAPRSGVGIPCHRTGSHLPSPSQGAEAEPGLQGRGLVTSGCPGGMCDMPHTNGQQKFKVITPNLPKGGTGNPADHTLNKMCGCLMKSPPNTHTQFPSFSRLNSLGVGVAFSFSIMYFFVRSREKDQKLSFQR